VLLEIISALRNIDPDAQQLIALLKGNNWCIITDEYIELVLRLALCSASSWRSKNNSLSCSGERTISCASVARAYD
jgi:hypothetical protein